MEKRIPMTKEGYDKLESQILKLESQDLREALNSLEEMRERGNIEDNSEYDVVKESYNYIQKKIYTMRENLKNSIIIDYTSIQSGRVQILNSVKILNLNTNKEMVVSIVPNNETDLKINSISTSSPIGSGLIGKKLGDEIYVKTPSGGINLKILEIFI